MSKKYYAVLKGRSTGIFDNWGDTQNAVSGYSGAVFKSFGNYQEANDYLLNGGSVKNTSESINNDNINILQIYTDGSHSRGNGGVGIVFTFNGKIINQFNFKITEYPTTNIRAELYAILVTLKIVASNNHDQSFEIYTDSEYAVNVFNVWIYTWMKNGWKNSTGSDVANKDLITQIQQLSDSFKCKGIIILLKWVKAHSNNYYNNLADQLAKSARDSN